MSDYNPSKELRDEVKRFKATNTFTPMQVTGFYIHAAVVLDQLDQLTRDHANLLKDLKAVTAHNERIQSEKCELAQELEVYKEDNEVLCKLEKYVDEKLGVKGDHSTFETVDNAAWKLSALTKERDDLAVKLAHAQMDLVKPIA